MGLFTFLCRLEMTPFDYHSSHEYPFLLFSDEADIATTPRHAVDCHVD